MYSINSRDHWFSGTLYTSKIFSRPGVPACTLAFHNHCGLSPGVTQPRVVFGVCKMGVLTGHMNCMREYSPASSAPLTETLNWLVSRVFSRTFTTFRRPTREEPVASANDFSSNVYDEIMRVILRAAGNRTRVTLKTYRNKTRRNLSATLLVTLRRAFFHTVEALKVDKYIIAPIWYDKYSHWSSWSCDYCS